MTQGVRKMTVRTGKKEIEKIHNDEKVEATTILYQE